METATRGRPSTASPADGSRTLTITSDPTREEGEDAQSNPQNVQPVGTLKLRGGSKEKSTQRVAWDDDVVDNEFFGKKKSKGMSCVEISFGRFSFKDCSLTFMLGFERSFFFF